MLDLSGVRIIGDTDIGAVLLLGAHIGGQLGCDGANMRNDSGPALVADSLQVGLGMLLRRGFTATGAGERGAVRLTGAHIGGSLGCDGASLRNDSGPALSGDALQVGLAIFLRRGLPPPAPASSGAVRLLSAHIGGSLDCTEASVRNGSGPALHASGLEVGQGMYLRRGFTATGSGGDGAVRLVGAHIGGSLVGDGAKLCNDSGPALAAYSLQVGQGMYLTGGFAATGGGEGVVIDLTGARVGGAFLFAPEQLKHKVDSHRLAVDGLTYAGVPGPISAQGWRGLLRDGTPRYAAQPYQQLAAGYRALGDDRQARETLMAQRDDQLARARPRWPERWWGWITKVTLGYGYKPWPAL